MDQNDQVSTTLPETYDFFFHFHHVKDYVGLCENENVSSIFLNQTPVFLLRVIQLVRWAILACLAHKSRVARLTSLVPFVSWKHSIKAEHIKNGPMLLKLLGKI